MEHRRSADVDDDEGDGAQGGGAEDECAVLVDLAGLDVRDSPSPGLDAALPEPLTAPSTTFWSMLS